MFTAMEIIVLFGFFCAFYYFRNYKHNQTDLPGPWALPIFGHMFFLGTRMQYTLTKWSKTYGKIFKVKLGGMETVVITDPALLREAFNLSVFSGRTDMETFSIANEGKNGIISSDGHIWVEQRRFGLRHLRDLGFGKKSMENMILEEVNDSIEGFRKEIGQPVFVNKKFSLAVLNSLWHIITGTRYSQDHPKLNQILSQSHETFGETAANPLIIFFPSIAKMFPRLTGWKNFVDVCATMRALFKKEVSDHKKTFVENSPRDLIDVYLDEITKTTDSKSSFYKEMGEKQLLGVMSDMFNAGSETTSNALQWVVFYLSQFRDIQSKLRAEIEQVIGRSRLPSLEDRQNMPFAEALIMEILRKASIVPLSLMHRVVEDTVFHGYLIPKGYNIFGNLYGIHHDSTVWKDPENFRPERFIDNSGRCIKSHDSLIPFSVGKRVCLGESLARNTTFLFMVSLIQQFDITPDPSEKNVTFEPKPGFVLAPQPFKVIFNEIK